MQIQIDPKFMGFQMTWFLAVVEDRVDPLKLGRLRIRILGSHTEDRTRIPTDELHWAHPVMPFNSGPTLNGLGESPTGPAPGTWVVGFWRDGVARQEPVVIGTVGGIPEEAAKKPKGFYDQRNTDEVSEKLENAPRKIKERSYPAGGAVLTDEDKAENYPRTIHPWGGTLNEPDTNRLARNEEIEDTIVQVKKDNRDTGVPIALGGTWDEPEVPYDAEYPFNHVRETESGHIVEFDDTPKAERTHQWHRTGTFVEVHPDGSEVHKIVMDGYEIVLRDKNVHVQGTCNITAKGNINILTESDANIEVKGNTEVKTDGNTKVFSGGTMDFESEGNMSFKAPRIDWNPSV